MQLKSPINWANYIMQYILHSDKTAKSCRRKSVCSHSVWEF